MAATFFVEAKDHPEYAVSRIPASLLKNAPAVVRLDSTYISVLAADKVVINETIITTINNKSADNSVNMALGYSSFVKINNVEGELLDANGKLLHKIKNSDFFDHAAYDGASLYNSFRVKQYEPAATQYPYTVVYHIEETLSDFFFLEHFFPLEDIEHSLQHSVCIIDAPSSFTFRYFEKNIDAVVKTKVKDRNIYTWHADAIPARDHEILMPRESEYLPIVYFASNDFTIEGFKGNMETWENLSKSFYDFYNDESKPLTTKTIAFLDSVRQNVPDVKQKIRLVYEYMQKRSRYVGIQVGLGGWKPFTADIVDQVGYGDCKALTNYTHILLKKLGIESFPALNYASSNGSYFPENFSQSVFNHVILCVPLENDTVWLENTSTVKPCGFLGISTSDRKVLLIKKEGGQLVSTPSLLNKNNIESRKVEVSLKDDGSATVQAVARYDGLNYDDIEGLDEMAKADQIKKLYSKLPLNDIVITDYKIETYKYAPTPYRIERILFKMNKPTLASGKRIMQKLNLLNSMKSGLTENTQRQFPVVLRQAYTEIDSVVFHLPTNMEVESLPAKSELKNEFGMYSMRAEKQGSDVVYIRRFDRNNGRFPASSYTTLFNFYTAISKQDNQKMMLLKKE
jgi:hypothetical protein